MPHSSGVVFYAVALSSILLLRRRGSIADVISDLPLSVFVAAFLSLYAGMTILWAPDPTSVLPKFLLPFGAAFGGYMITRAIAELESKQIGVICATLLAVIIGFAFYLFIQLVTGMGISWALYDLLPAPYALDFDHLKIENGEVVGIRVHELNKGIALMAALLWPTLWLLEKMSTSIWRRVCQGSLVFVVTVSTFMSNHEASKLALLIGASIFLIMHLRKKAPVFQLLCAAWLALSMLIVPAALLADKAGLTTSSFIQASGKARLIIWATTAEKVPEAPLFGAGVRSVKVNYKRQPPETRDVIRDGEVYPRRLGPHTHNTFLQTWYELGFIGAIMYAGLGLLVLRGISWKSDEFQKWAYPTFATVMLFLSLGWGLWAVWQHYAFALVAITLLVVERFDIKSLVSSAREEQPQILNGLVEQGQA